VAIVVEKRRGTIRFAQERPITGSQRLPTDAANVRRCVNQRVVART
jgi:hypothetical protein